MFEDPTSLQQFFALLFQIRLRNTISLIIPAFNRSRGFLEPLMKPSITFNNEQQKINHSLMRHFDIELVYLCKRFGIPKTMYVEWSEVLGSKVNPLSIPNMLWELALMSVGHRTDMWKAQK